MDKPFYRFKQGADYRFHPVSPGFGTPIAQPLTKQHALYFLITNHGVTRMSPLRSSYHGLRMEISTPEPTRHAPCRCCFDNQLNFLPMGWTISKNLLNSTEPTSSALAVTLSGLHHFLGEVFVWACLNCKPLGFASRQATLHQCPLSLHCLRESMKALPGQTIPDFLILLSDPPCGSESKFNNI